jgi:hypothetical protein
MALVSGMGVVAVVADVARVVGSIHINSIVLLLFSYFLIFLFASFILSYL